MFLITLLDNFHPLLTPPPPSSPPPPPQECERVEWRSTMVVNTSHIWIPEVEEGDGGNYTCELQYGSRLVRRTTQLKVTGRLGEGWMAWGAWVECLGGVTG
ncbi:hypothetical protein NHX12_010824 [Muraenolepis orangiensis]|uniref:Ig-like domain-containing protein n=1 Tax=Muraenolepis orangiensis TaxID=630683 RepID=A0A9Q0DF69_9TELE|nr:hypothetical protein NHX12_010824 [Muraenolepis orangiensis]